MKQGNPADIVYDYIKNQIVTKAIYPGTRIVEEELVRETGVSRTPVRSALMRLAYDGLIQQQPNRGAVVAKPSATDLRQVYEARAVLEVGAFRAAVHRRSDESVLQMEQNLQKQPGFDEPLQHDGVCPAESGVPLDHHHGGPERLL